MAQGREYSQGQRKIIDRYYQHKDTIMAGKLAEIASELFLAEGKAVDRLWKRAETAMTQAKVPPSRIATLVEKRDVQLLAKLAGELA